MKKILTGLVFLYSFIAYSQTDVYSLTSGELVFSGANMTNNGNRVNADMRFTCFLHLGEYVHVDFNNNIGMFTGLALRNVGIMTKDGINDPINMNDQQNKVVRRSYDLGVPLAIKLGVFDKKVYVFGGAEYEMLFHYKEKYWIDGQKHKSNEWFSNKTNFFVPSVFAGVQFPGGLHMQFKYYLGDFLNNSYKELTSGGNGSDYTKVTESRMFYVSLSWQIRSDKLLNKMEKEFFETASR
jgi:hypothetical protein